MIGWIFKLLVLLAVLGGIGLVGFANLGDLDPDQHRVTEPVTLPLGAGQ